MSNGDLQGDLTEGDVAAIVRNNPEAALAAIREHTGDAGAHHDPPNRTVRAVSGSATTSGEAVVLVDTSGGTATITLVTAGATEGARRTIKDSAGSAGTNAITVATEGTETIDGASTATIGTNHGSIEVVSDGSNWFVVG